MTPEVLTDAIIVRDGQVTAHGSVAQRLLQSNFSVNSLRTNAVLRKEEWLLFDTAVIEVARQRLRLVGDLLTAGLRFDVSNPLGTTIIEWEKVSDMTAADVSMSGVTPGERDRPVFNLDSVPLPIIHKDFSINIRALEASRRIGETLDVTAARLATRLVSEKIEDILVNGFTLTVGTATIFGYTTAPNRNTGSLPLDWADGATTGELILTDVISMINAAIADNMYGPYVLYVPKTYFVKMGEDFKTNSDRTIMERILALPDISALRPSDNLGDGASGEVLLVQMTSDVVDMVNGMQPTPLQWEGEGGMIVNFKIMALMVPRMKSDNATQSGIMHFSV